MFSSRFRVSALLLLLMIFTAMPVLQAQSELRAVTMVRLLNIRSGPGTNFPVMEQVVFDTTMMLNGRTADSVWVRGYVVLDPTINGWVSATLVATDPGTFVNGLPIVDAAVDVTAPVVSPPVPVAPGVPVVPENPVPAAAAIPTLPPVQTFTFSPRVSEIFALGQNLGNRADTFIKLGDSVTVEEFYLESFAEGDYELGGYAYLQPTIDFFNVSGSFKVPSFTSGSGFSTLTLLDPIWSNPEFCLPNETLLSCEIRLKRPAVALIYLAGNDLNAFSPGQYNGYMRLIVDELVANGVIPVMSTFGVDPDYRPDVAPAFNQTIRSIASDYQIPWIDLYTLLQPLPNGGVYTDEYHLTLRRDGVISFVTDQNEYGATMRELVTLQLLHELRLEVMGR